MPRSLSVNDPNTHEFRAAEVSDALRCIDDARFHISSVVYSLSDTGNQCVADEWQKLQDQLDEIHVKAEKLAR